MSEIIPIKGFIYLIKMYNMDKKIIYKVGKSTNFYKRFQNYDFPNLLIFINSDDITIDEYEIIKLFKINCKLHKGREFFTAQDDYFVLDLFINYFSNKNKKNIETNNITNIVSDLINDLINEVVNKVINDEFNNNIISNEIVSYETINNIKNRKIDYICPNINCNKTFNYCSYLKKHLLNSYHCNKTIDNINLYILEINKIRNNNIVKFIKEYKCSNCKKNYHNNFTLQRHMNTSKCNKVINLNKQISNLQLELEQFTLS
jgi:hypothetical protein